MSSGVTPRVSSISFIDHAKDCWDFGFVPSLYCIIVCDLTKKDKIDCIEIRSIFDINVPLIGREKYRLISGTI